MSDARLSPPSRLLGLGDLGELPGPASDPRLVDLVGTSRPTCADVCHAVRRGSFNRQELKEIDKAIRTEGTRSNLECVGNAQVGDTLTLNWNGETARAELVKLNRVNARVELLETLDGLDRGEIINFPIALIDVSGGLLAEEIPAT